MSQNMTNLGSVAPVSLNKLSISWFFIPGISPERPPWKLRAFNKRPLQHAFLNGTGIPAEILAHCDSVGTIGNKTVTMMTFLLLRYYVFIGSYMYVRESIFQFSIFYFSIEVAWESNHAWGFATNVTKARTEDQSGPVWRWAASLAPNYTRSCCVTRVEPGSPGRMVAL